MKILGEEYSLLFCTEEEDPAFLTDPAKTGGCSTKVAAPAPDLCQSVHNSLFSSFQKQYMT